MARPTALTVRAAFTTDPLATPTWTDISPYVRAIGNISRGRQWELDRWEPGEMRGLILSNSDRRFEPQFASSPYSPNVLPGKRLNVRVTHNAITYDIFTGFAENWVPMYPGVKDAIVSVDAYDVLALCRQKELRNPYLGVVLADSPKGLWFLGDQPGAPVLDSSGNGRNGILTGPQPATVGPLVGYGASSFDGVSDYVTLPSSASITASSWSVELWFKHPPKSTATDEAIFVQVGGSPYTAVMSMLGTSSIGTVSFNAPILNSGIRLDDDKWHHVVVAYDGTTGKMYVDGALVSTNTGAVTEGASVVVLGWYGDFAPSVAVPAYFAGSIAGVAIYDGVVLSSTRVTEHYNARNAWVDDRTDTRLGRLLDLVGVASGDRTLAAGQSILLDAFNYEGSDALSEMVKAVNAEDGALWVDGDGKVTFQDRHARYKSPLNASVATFGDGGGAEVKYRDIVPSFDRDRIYNLVEITSEDGPTLTYQDTASQGDYGIGPLRETLPVYPNECLNRAEYKGKTYKDPLLRFSRITIKPGTNDARWVQVLSRKPGDCITVKMRPPGGGAVLSKDCHIEAVEHRPGGPSNWGGWETDFLLSPVDPGAPYWILGDTTYSVLGSTTKVGY